MAKQPAPSANAEQFFIEAENLVANLYARWLDEKGCEDIRDYQTPLDKVAAKFGVKIVRMTAHPFGCEFQVDGRTYKLTCSQKTYAYKRIA
jgi:hypothetical protein